MGYICITCIPCIRVNFIIDLNMTSHIINELSLPAQSEKKAQVEKALFQVLFVIYFAYYNEVDIYIRLRLKKYFESCIKYKTLTLCSAKDVCEK